MSRIYETKGLWADKVALFGFLIAGLLIARFIIASKSAVVLSGPIMLDYTGLSISIPAGNGWQSEKRWKYQDNSFVLSSVFVPGTAGPTAMSYCQYLLTESSDTPDLWFDEQAAVVSGRIVGTGQTRTGSLVFDWAQIENSEALFDMFFATALLPNNRQLKIEVSQTTGDTDLAEQVFRQIIENIEFEGNPILEVGSDIVMEIKAEGLDSFFEPYFVKGSRAEVSPDSRSRRNLFVIKDASKQAIGFVIDVLVDFASDKLLNVQAASLFYIRGRYTSEQATFFRSDYNFDEFIWKNEISNIKGKSANEVIAGKDGVITVRGFSPQIEEKSYQSGPAAIPEVFIEFIFSKMFNRGHKEAIVDIVNADGTIIPTLISRFESEDAAVVEEGVGYIFNLNPLNNPGSFQRFYLDEQMHILKILLRQENIYTLELTSEENILREFPERADYILHGNEIFQQDQL